jgi:hypothetical protein
MQSFRRSFLPGSDAAGSASPRSYGAFAARVQIGIESPRCPLAPLAGAARGIAAAIWTGHVSWLRSHRTIKILLLIGLVAFVIGLSQAATRHAKPARTNLA